MPNRREFLQSAALALALGSTASGQEQKAAPSSINATLGCITEKLRGCKAVGNVDERLADNPHVGFVQWKWAHFRAGIDPKLYPQVERVNGELLTAMQCVSELPDDGLEQLLHEGFIEGAMEGQVAEYRRIQRELIERLFTVYHPFSLGDIKPPQKTVDQELNVAGNLRKPVNHIIIYPGNRRENLRMSVLGRLGAGYVLSTQQETTLLPAEDPELDRKAEKAEQSGDEAEYKKCVMDERDRHFLKLVRASKQPIVHLLVGYGHDLTDDVETAEKDGARISHLIVNVKSLATEKPEPMEAAALTAP